MALLPNHVEHRLDAAETWRSGDERTDVITNSSKAAIEPQMAAFILFFELEAMKTSRSVR